MSLAVSILASGSSGNCSILRAGRQALLIDCGIGPRSVANRMAGLGIRPDDISAIVLTHLDQDHFNPTWVAQVLRRKIRLFVHQNHRRALLDRTSDNNFSEQVETFNGHPFSPLEDVSAVSLRLPHDEAGSHAFRFQSFGATLGYASDLGRVPPELIDLMCEADVLAIESNYDPKMQEISGRPLFLRQRIMGGHGHLSNAQALEAVRKILDRREIARRPLPKHIVLLHRSRQCNCPNLLREVFQTDPRIATRLVLAEQNLRTDWLHATRKDFHCGSQLLLPWG